MSVSRGSLSHYQQVIMHICTSRHSSVYTVCQPLFTVCTGSSPGCKSAHLLCKADNVRIHICSSAHLLVRQTANLQICCRQTRKSAFQPGHTHSQPNEGVTVSTPIFNTLFSLLLQWPNIPSNINKGPSALNLVSYVRGTSKQRRGFTFLSRLWISFFKHWLKIKEWSEPRLALTTDTPTTSVCVNCNHSIGPNQIH